MSAAPRRVSLALLDGYNVRWNRQTVARDIVQNFFDEVDDFGQVTIEVDPARGRVRVAGPSTFKMDYLRYVGATTKAGRRTAGGFGEGFKICALVLLRDYGVEVVAGSRDWVVRPVLVPMKLGRELCYDVTRSARRRGTPGSFVELTGADARLCQAFEGARQLFRHPTNPRLAKPMFVDEKRGLGVYFASDPKKADLFYRRQHRGTLPFSKGAGLTFACDDALEGHHADRDRRDLQSARPVIQAVVAALPTDAIEKLVRYLRPYWQGGNAVLSALLAEAKERGARFTFSRRWVARCARSSYQFEDAAARRGLLVAGRAFAAVGMEAVDVRLGGVALPRQPTRLEAARIAVAQALHDELVGEPPPFKGIRVTEMARPYLYGSLALVSARALRLPFEQGVGEVLAALVGESGRHKASNADRLTQLLEAVIARKGRFAEYRRRWLRGEAPRVPAAEAEPDALDADDELDMGQPLIVTVVAPSGFPPTRELARQVQRLCAAHRPLAATIVQVAVNGPRQAAQEFARGVPNVWIEDAELEPLRGAPRFVVRTFSGGGLLPTDEALLASLQAAYHRERRTYGAFARMRRGAKAGLRYDREHHPEAYRRAMETEAVSQASKELPEAEGFDWGEHSVVRNAAVVALASGPWDEATLPTTALEHLRHACARLRPALEAMRAEAGAPPPDSTPWRGLMEHVVHLLREGAAVDVALAAARARAPGCVELAAGMEAAPLDASCRGTCTSAAMSRFLWRARTAPLEAALQEARTYMEQCVQIAVERHGRTDRYGETPECAQLIEELDVRLGPTDPAPRPSEGLEAQVAEAVGSAWREACSSGCPEVEAAGRCLEAAAEVTQPVALCDD